MYVATTYNCMIILYIMHRHIDLTIPGCQFWNISSSSDGQCSSVDCRSIPFTAEENQNLYAHQSVSWNSKYSAYLAGCYNFLCRVLSMCTHSLSSSRVNKVDAGWFSRFRMMLISFASPVPRCPCVCKWLIRMPLCQLESGEHHRRIWVLWMQLLLLPGEFAHHFLPFLVLTWK